MAGKKIGRTARPTKAPAKVPTKAATKAATKSAAKSATGAPGSNGQKQAKPGVAEMPSIAHEAVWDALRSPLRIRLLEAICAKPGIEARSLADALDSTAPRVHYHINILLAAGLIVPDEEGAATEGTEVSRGASAIGFRAVFSMIPRDCFAGNAEAEARALRLLREVAEEGIASMSPIGRPRNGMARFCHEALLASEIDEVVGHLTKVREILDRARARRHQRRTLARASVFVGFCMASVTDPVLPDGPLGWEEPLGPAVPRTAVR